MGRRDPGAGQIGLFGPHVVLPAQPTDTQLVAAARALPESGRARRRVFEAIVAAGEHGATDEELQGELGMNSNTQRPRRLELARTNPPLILDSGKRRPTRSGARAIVWIATTANYH